MRHVSAGLRADILRRHGLVTADELRTDGFDPHGIQRLVERGVIVHVHRGVYRAASIDDTFESRCAAACLADRHPVVTGPSAARLWDFRFVFHPFRPDVCVPHEHVTDGRNRRPLVGVSVRGVTGIDDVDIVLRDDAIRLTTPARTWFDCARHLNEERFVDLTRHVLESHCGPKDLWDVIDRLSRQRRAGTRRVNAVMASKGAWRRTTNVA